MPGDRIVVDGLWRCLCPSIDTALLGQHFHVPRRPSPSRPTLTSCRKPPRLSLQCCRATSTSPATSAISASPIAPTRVGASDGADKQTSRVKYLKRLAKRYPWLPTELLKESDNDDKFTIALHRTDTRTIYATLKHIQASQGTCTPATSIALVEFLVRDRGEAPNAALYEALIKANTSRKGSAAVVKQLFKEMQSHNIPTTLGVYQALLQVMVVHPDYVLRSQVLHDMKNRWLALDANAQLNVICGLLRDAQYELAFSKFEQFNSTHQTAPPWLFDVFLYVFGDLGFHHETLAILKRRQNITGLARQEPLSLNAWHFLLGVFGRDSFYLGVKYVWDRMVAHGYISPPDGVVLSALNTASRSGDTTLAMAAIQTLSARGVKLDLHHYEPLIQLHIQHKDLQKAFAVLCIMAKAGLSPDLSCTRPIFQMLRDSKKSTDDALQILKGLKQQHVIPAAAFNVVLEATIIHRNLPSAIDMYRSVRQVCANGPDIETFELLLRKCTHFKRMLFLVADMEAFCLKPTQPILDDIVRVCDAHNRFTTAFKYLQPATEAAPWFSSKSAFLLLRRCIETEDPRAELIVRECRRRGMDGDISKLYTRSVAKSRISTDHADPPIDGESSPPEPPVRIPNAAAA
ncbi:hypothetical protein GGR57DRAFT_497544 [Xylariaceae sp. FL1272]|nr:hypothetical protein GGR57DRAFT_497544 [Xylariaceae sp. FL1272]